MGNRYRGLDRGARHRCFGVAWQARNPRLLFDTLFCFIEPLVDPRRERSAKAYYYCLRYSVKKHPRVTRLRSKSQMSAGGREGACNNGRIVVRK